MNTDLNTWVSVLDTLSHLAEVLPFHWSFLAGAILAGVVMVLRKVQAAKEAAKASAPELAKAPVATAPAISLVKEAEAAAPEVVAAIADITEKTFKQK